MADSYISDGSDIDLDIDTSDNESNYITADSDTDNYPLDNAQQNNDLDENRLFHDFMFDDSDDDEEFVGFQNEWKTNPDDFRPRHRSAYTQQSGCTTVLPPETPAKLYFGLFWDDECIQHIVDETNRYANQQRELNPPPPYAAKWTDVCKADIETFLGLCLLMGIIKMPHRHDYWRRTKWLLETKFNDIMTRDRFDLIWRYLHLQNNGNNQGTD